MKTQYLTRTQMYITKQFSWSYGCINFFVKSRFPIFEKHGNFVLYNKIETCDQDKLFHSKYLSLFILSIIKVQWLRPVQYWSTAAYILPYILDERKFHDYITQGLHEMIYFCVKMLHSIIDKRDGVIWSWEKIYANAVEHRV